jgi:hypothetical protein
LLAISSRSVLPRDNILESTGFLMRTRRAAGLCNMGTVHGAQVPKPH